MNSAAMPQAPPPKNIRELKIDDAATPRPGVNIYDTKKGFWNLMSVTTV